MKTEFFMPMIPPTMTAQEKDITVVKSKKTGKHIPIVYEPTELKAVRSKLEAHLSKHIPDKSFVGATQIVAKWLFPITGSHKNGEWKITKPDLENLEKMPFDIMQDLGFYKNDAILCSKITQKFYATIPGIFISIESLE
jgi:Holliday junction resolvase RusA-like endonuclease